MSALRRTTVEDETKWLRWLRAVTRERSERAIARKVGVSHTTVQRWVAKGIQPETVWRLVVRFSGDPVQAVVVLGWMEPEQVRLIDWAKVAEYMPTYVMTEELNKRAHTTRRDFPHIKLQKLEAVV
jgi:hypothetical protein